MTKATVKRVLPTRWARPANPKPIVFIGAGGIVRSAHVPAYRALGFPIAGVYDLRQGVANALAAEYGIQRVFKSLDEAARSRDVVFDVAVPAGGILPVLRGLPAGAPVLIQKPMGRNLAEAVQILTLCRKKRLLAAVNFQLRFSPNMIALRELIRRGELGDVVDFEVRVQTYTPWSNWSFMEGIPRLEILYHSIHYLDLTRFLFGKAKSIHALASRDPRFPGHADTRASIAFECGAVRCVVNTNHHHKYTGPYAMSQLKVEGTRGAAVAKMGVNLDYPKGEPDELWFAKSGGSFRRVKLPGSWFPMAFEGTMANLQRFVSGEDKILLTRVEDAVQTMALVEACYRSSARGGAPTPSVKS